MSTLWFISLVKLEISPQISEQQKLKWNNREENLRNCMCFILKCLTKFAQQLLLTATMTPKAMGLLLYTSLEEFDQKMSE